MSLMRTYRRALGLSQSAFAARLNVPLETYRPWVSASLSENAGGNRGWSVAKTTRSRRRAAFFRSAIASMREGRPTARFRWCGRDRGGGEPRRGNLTGVQPAALAVADPPSRPPKPVGKPDG